MIGMTRVFSSISIPELYAQTKYCALGYVPGIMRLTAYVVNIGAGSKAKRREEGRSGYRVGVVGCS